MRRKILSSALSLSFAASAFAGFAVPAHAAEVKTPQYQETARQMEKIDRGLIAVKTTADTRQQTVNGVYLSWRLLGTESLENQAFDIYRNGTKIKTTGAHDATNYIDTAGTTSSVYKVVPAGTSADAEPGVTPFPTNHYAKPSEVGNGYSEKNSFTYIDVPLQRPADVKTSDGDWSYYYNLDKDHEGGANDASVGDLDGDGQYEIVLKWDPTNSKDTINTGLSGNVYIDAYEITTSADNFKWRIDLGPSIRAGAHDTQFLVYDFNGDGRSEVVMQTAPGSKDSTGAYVTNVGDTEEIRNTNNTEILLSKGHNIGADFYTVFDGETGVALCTTAGIPLGATNGSDWGDSKLQRAHRFLGAVAYLDGVHPAIVMCRGYYDRAVVRAYTWDGVEMSLLWEHDGASKGAESLYGQGNHNLSVADVDNDGKDEIVYGSAVLDDDGKAIGNTFLGHGDAMHVNDFNNDGVQEVFSVKEKSEGYKTDAANFRVAGTGQRLFGVGASGDTGRGLMANIDDAYAKTHPNALSLGWTSSHTNVFDLTGAELGAKPSKAGSGTFDNFLVFWDGDLSRELLDANIIQKYNAETGSTRRFYGPSDGYSLTGGSTNNYTKRTPCLVADLWGDWREEIIMGAGKGKDETPTLRIYTSTLPSNYRLTTLMHDSQYRMAIAWQNVGYNQPPHTSYYVGSVALATDANGNALNYLAPETPYTKVVYELENIPVTGISIPDSEVVIEKGHTELIRTAIEPAGATNKSIVWTSSDTSVATVSNGTVKGVSVGEATITATTRDGGFSATCKVSVFSNPVTSIVLDNTSIELGTDATKQLTAAVSPANATDKSITWTSSNSAVATVDTNGVVTGISDGTAVITATTNDGGFKATCNVTVFPLISTDATGSNVFETSNTDSATTLTGTATSATFKQSGAAVGGEFYKTFKAYSDNRASITFKFNTGGQKDASGNWSWTGREYTFGLQFLDTEGNNILDISQAYTDKAQTTMGKIGTNAAASISTWTQAIAEGENPVGRSSTRWFVTVEFDYDNDTATATLAGSTSDWVQGITYKKTFNLNGASFEKLRYYTTVDGAGAISVAPTLTDLVYTRTEVGTPSGSTNLLYSKGTAADNAWTDADLTDWVQTNTATAALTLDTSADNGRLLYNPTKPGSSYNATKTFDLADNSVVTYNADWYFGSSTSRASNVEYIQFGSNLRIGWTYGYGTYVSVDGGASYPFTVGDDGKTITDTSNSIFKGANDTYTKNVTVTFDTTTNTIKSLKFDGKVLDAYTDYVLPEGTTFDSVSFGFQRGGATDNWGYPCGLESLVVSEYVEGVIATPIPTTPPAKDYGIKVTNVDGNKVDFTACFETAQDKAVIIGALYDESGALSEIKTINLETVVADEDITDTFIFTNAESGCSLKLYVWDSLKGMTPIFNTDSKTF